MNALDQSISHSFPSFTFDNSYERALPQLCVSWDGDKFPDPKVLRLNASLAQELGLNAKDLATSSGAAILAGGARAEGSAPIAMAYAGHQFGGFSPLLGDGRALLLGEIIDKFGNRRDLHLKGSGRTPFSRGADGKAALGPVLREHLMGEAMHAFGIPTTRALATTTTGETVFRDGRPKQGAVLARIAASHLRVGTFQFVAYQRNRDSLKNLADYAIDRHWPELAGEADRYILLLRRVIGVQADLVSKWMLVGFVHGVMNTDNMTISGETIDYGPCAFLDTYNSKAVFSSIDTYGRYAYANQPPIAQWNLARFAETLLPLIKPDDVDDAARQAIDEIKAFPSLYQEAWLKGMRAKIGLRKEHPEDLQLVSSLLKHMEDQKVDFTRGFRSFARVAKGELSAIVELFEEAPVIKTWLDAYTQRADLEAVSPEDRAEDTLRANPIYIPRNHLVEAALTAAEKGDMEPFDKLLEAVSQPFTEREGLEDLVEGAPESFGKYTTYCGT